MERIQLARVVGAWPNWDRFGGKPLSSFNTTVSVPYTIVGVRERCRRSRTVTQLLTAEDKKKAVSWLSVFYCNGVV